MSSFREHYIVKDNHSRCLPKPDSHLKETPMKSVPSQKLVKPHVNHVLPLTSPEEDMNYSNVFPTANASRDYSSHSQDNTSLEGCVYVVKDSMDSPAGTIQLRPFSVKRKAPDPPVESRRDGKHFCPQILDCSVKICKDLCDQHPCASMNGAQNVKPSTKTYEYDALGGPDSSSLFKEFPGEPDEDSLTHADMGIWVSAKAYRASSSSSSDSQDSVLPSLEELMRSRPPPTPSKDAYSEPGTPQTKRAIPKCQSVQPSNIKNTLDKMIKDIKINQRSKEKELEVLYFKDVLKQVEAEENGKDDQDSINPEQRDILKKFSLFSTSIPHMPPGEEVFIQANYGRLFSQNTLDLSKCNVVPQNMAQKTLFQSSPQLFPLLVSTGLLVKAYRSCPCQPAVSRWLFQMMAVHSDRNTSLEILHAMKVIALVAAEHVVVNQCEKFNVWMPSIQDVALVLLNLGVSFVTLFPLESLQPSFSEGDILQNTPVCTEDMLAPRRVLIQSCFPQHNIHNLLEYLSVCARLAPHAYSDHELLLLLALVCKVSLEVQLQLSPTEHVRNLLEQLLDNNQDWERQLPLICNALSDLTEDHHNLRWLVQLLPITKRGKELRRNLSMLIISKLLNHSYTFIPSSSEYKLTMLKRYLPCMRLSKLKVMMKTAKGQENEEDDSVSVDLQAHYLCYSLLTLLSEATSFEHFPSHLKVTFTGFWIYILAYIYLSPLRFSFLQDDLKTLNVLLHKCIGSEIREKENFIYRCKVKDFVARIWTRWDLLLRSVTEQGKLYEYYYTAPEDALLCSTQPSPHEEDEENPNRTSEQENEARATAPHRHTDCESC